MFEIIIVSFFINPINPISVLNSVMYLGIKYLNNTGIRQPVIGNDKSFFFLQQHNNNSIKYIVEMLFKKKSK